jgi:hypothetical protein
MKQQIGGYEFKNEINRIRQSSTIIGDSLLKIIETNPGPQTLYALITKMAVHNSIIIDATTKVEKIGANQKEQRTT